MPSSPNYVRDYAQEHKTAKARGERGGHDSGDTIRARARRHAIKLGMIKKGSKKDIDHIHSLSHGGSENAASNLRVRSQHDNRSFPRNSAGGMIRNEPKTTSEKGMVKGKKTGK